MLGPLFLIYINDLPDILNSTIRLYADECVIYRNIMSVNDCTLVQNDLPHIQALCREWQMEINVDNTKFLNFTTKKKKTLLRLTIYFLPYQLKP